MSESTHPHSGETGHAPLQPNMRMLWGSIIIFVAIIAGAMVLMSGFVELLSGGQSAVAPVTADPLAPAVASPLNPDQVAQRRRYETAQKELLTTSGWIDEKQKIARIPISDAMARVVEEYREQP